MSMGRGGISMKSASFEKEKGGLGVVFLHPLQDTRVSGEFSFRQGGLDWSTNYQMGDTRARTSM